MNDFLSRIGPFAALLAFALAWAGCNQDLGLEGKVFSCNEPSDCADGFECDMDAGICVAEGSDSGLDTDMPDASDGGDTTDAADSGDDADGLVDPDVDDDTGCTQPDGCPECSGDAECPDGRCVEGICVPESCGSNDDCPTGFACQDGRCARACDAKSECGEDRYCTEGGFCDAIPAPNATNACSDSGQCSDRTTCSNTEDPTAGTCIPWRCEYSQLVGECPTYSYCDAFPISGESINLCRSANCILRDPNACQFGGGFSYTCVTIAGARGRCEIEGDMPAGEGCDIGAREPASSCRAGTVCEPVRDTTGICRTTCDPWADTSSCGEGFICTPGQRSIGVCVPRVETRQGRCSNTDELHAACDDASRCLEVDGEVQCTFLCRVDGQDCASGLSCDPSAVPGAVGFGRCVETCDSDDACEDGVCRQLFDDDNRVCMNTCSDDSDCGGFGMICKDGFCD